MIGAQATPCCFRAFPPGCGSSRNDGIARGHGRVRADEVFQAGLEERASTVGVSTRGCVWTTRSRLVGEEVTTLRHRSTRVSMRRSLRVAGASGGTGLHSRILRRNFLSDTVGTALIVCTCAISTRRFLLEVARHGKSEQHELIY